MTPEEPGRNHLRRLLAGEVLGNPPFFAWPPAGFLLEAYGPDPEGFWLDPEVRAGLLARFASEVGADGVVIAGPGPGPFPDGGVLETRGDADLFQAVMKGGSRIEFPSRGKPRYFPPPEEELPWSLESLDPDDLFYLDPLAPWAGTRERQAEMKKGGEKGLIPYTDSVKRLVKKTGGKTAAAGFLYDPLSQLMGFMGFEGLIELLVTEPVLAKETLRALGMGTKALGLALGKAGAEVLVLGAQETDAGVLSRKAWGRFVRPVEEKLIGGLQEEGLPVFYAVPPFSADRFGEILGLGAEGLVAPPPPPEGDLPWEWLVAGWRRTGKGILAGGIDPRFMARGRPEEIAEAVRSLREAMKREDPWVLSTSGPLLPETPLENVLAVSKKGSS